MELKLDGHNDVSVGFLSLVLFFLTCIIPAYPTASFTLGGVALVPLPSIVYILNSLLVWPSLTIPARTLVSSIKR